MLVCAFFYATCTRDRGCSAHPAFPAPSCSRGTTSCAKLGQSVSREHGSLSVSGEALIKLNPAPPCHCEAHLRRSNPFFLFRGRLDCFAHQSRIRATVASQ